MPTLLLRSVFIGKYSLFLKSMRKAHTDGLLFILHYLNFCCKKLHIIRTVLFPAKGTLRKGLKISPAKLLEDSLEDTVAHFGP